MKTEHTSMPLELIGKNEYGYVILQENGVEFATVSILEKAALIVRAYNSHDELVEYLEELLAKGYAGKKARAILAKAKGAA